MTDPVTIEVTDEAAAARTLDGHGQFTRADFLKRAMVGGGALVAGRLMISGLPELVEARAQSAAQTYRVSVKKALASQLDLIEDAEHCSADPETLARIGRAAGQQVRLERSSSQYALYTVSETRQESPDNVVRAGAGGRRRLGTSAEFAGRLNSQVPHPRFTDTEAKANSEFVERLTDDGRHRGLIAIAPHGGEIEPYTDKQAERVVSRLANKGVSSWRCKGWKEGGGAHERWHITSTDIHPASFPKLNRVIARRFKYAVAFHGFGRRGILIGGAAPGSLKQEVARAIERAVAGSGIAVRVAKPGDDLGGSSKRNIVNRLTAHGAGGIQIEQSLSARARHGLAIADAVASVYRRKVG